MNRGYMGKILLINLSNNEIKIEEPNELFYKTFLGGVGIGVRHLFTNLPANIDPLGPDNILGFITGLFNGTGIVFSGRYSVVGKSPLTNTWGDANSGGFFGLGLKKSGFDAIFINGISDTPVYIFIDDGKAEIRDASDLWGKTTHETDDLIIKKHEGKKIRIASIGPSGEKLSLISGIINDHGRAAARSGLGAVMGSKKLKALVVSGNQKIEIAYPDKLKEVKNVLKQKLGKKPNIFMRIFTPMLKSALPRLYYKRGKLPKVGTATMMNVWEPHGTTMATAMAAEMGDASTKNWGGVGSRDFPFKTKSSKLDGVMMDKYVKRKFGCVHCGLPCSAILEVESKEIHRPEYETLAIFGSNLLNDDLESIIEANYICNLYGIDTISAGSTIGFAMECYENGLLSREDLDGIDLTWGNAENILKFLRKLVTREGCGDLFADGVKKAAEKIGKGSEKYAMHVHGQEIPMHDPRLSPSYGTTYVTDPTPARHTQGGLGLLEFGAYYPNLDVKMPKLKRYQYSGKGEPQASESRTNIAYLNSIGMCYFGHHMGTFPIQEAMKAVTGWDFTIEDLLETGDRIQALRQSFNVREGIKPSDFKLPDRLKGIPPLDAGATKGITIDLDTMVKEFYEAMDWDLKTGKPSKEKLFRLKLDDVAEELYSK